MSFFDSPVTGYDLEMLHSDVTDPVNPSEPLEYDGGSPKSHHQHEGVRTLSGLLDLMHHVRDEIDEWIERESDGPGHTWPRHRDKAMVLQTYSRGSKSWRADTYDLNSAGNGNGVKLASQRDGRSYVVVTNWGPNIAYISHNTSAKTNSVRIPPPGPDASQTGVRNWRVFPTEGEIWGFPGSAGTSQTVDVMEFYTPPESAA